MADSEYEYSDYSSSDGDEENSSKAEIEPEDEEEEVEKYKPRLEDIELVLGKEVPTDTEQAICFPDRMDTFGRWMSRRTGVFKDGKKHDKELYSTGTVSLMELDGVFKLSFQSFGVSPDAPPLHLYLSRQRAQRGMGDVEDNGEKVFMDADDGCVGKTNTKGNFEQLVAHLKDPLEFVGVYVIKEALTEPVTSEFVLYGFANLESYAVPLPSTVDVLGIHNAADKIEQLKTRVKAIKGIPTSAEETTLKHVKRSAARAWRHFKLDQKASIDFLDFKDFLDYLDIVVLEPRALKLFHECDMDNSGSIQISEFEIALLMNAHLPLETSLHPVDAFATFDLDKSGCIDKGEFMEACAVMGVDTSDKDKVDKLFIKADKDKSGGVDLEEFKAIWVFLVDAAEELEKRDLTPAVGWGSEKKNKKRLLRIITEEEHAR